MQIGAIEMSFIIIIYHYRNLRMLAIARTARTHHTDCTLAVDTFNCMQLYLRLYAVRCIRLKSCDIDGSTLAGRCCTQSTATACSRTRSTARVQSA